MMVRRRSPVFYPGVYAVSYDSTVYTAQKVNEVVTAQDANQCGAHGV